MINRRDFIQQSILISAGMLVAPSLASAKTFTKAGLQLYTVRDQIGKDVKGVIEKTAKAGYNDVETYGYDLKNKFWGLTPQDFSSLLKDNGMICSSGHFGMEMLLTSGKYDDLHTYIAAANIVGLKYIVVPHMALEVRATSDQYKDIAEKLNKAAEICGKSGLKMGYHNHDFEFLKLADGKMGYDILLQNTDPKLVDFEMDLYWAVRGGHDPIELFQQYPGRFKMLHIKDMSKEDPKMETEIGKGTINFKQILANAKLAGVKSFFMEQENNYKPDLFGSITQSAIYIKKELM